MRDDLRRLRRGKGACAELSAFSTGGSKDRMAGQLCHPRYGLQERLGREA